jgi:hypothetical protein
VDEKPKEEQKPADEKLKEKKKREPKVVNSRAAMLESAQTHKVSRDGVASYLCFMRCDDISLNTHLYTIYSYSIVKRPQRIK